MENFDILHFLKLDFSCLKSILFYQEFQKNDHSWLDLPKNQKWEKWPFLAKNHGLTPLENFDFTGLFWNFTFVLQRAFFSFQNIKKRCFLAGFPQKPLMRKMANFCKKAWTNPFGTFRFFWAFLKLDFSFLKRIIFYAGYQKRIFPGWICAKVTNEKTVHFLPKTID